MEAELNNTEILKMMNIAFKNERRDRIENEIDSAIRIFLGADARRNDTPLTNTFSVFSNYLKLIIRRKLVNPNYILSSAIKWTKGYVGLFLIGMIIREGANPNVYYSYTGRGNLHVIAWTAVVKPANYMYHHIVTVLRMLGADIYRPAIRFEGDSEDVDVRLVEQAFEDGTYGSDDYYFKAGLNVKDYVMQSGYNIEKNVSTHLNSVDDEWLLDILIATDDVKRLNTVITSKWKYIEDIIRNEITLSKFIIDLSTAFAVKIATSMENTRYPKITDIINAQSVPLFATSVSCDPDLFTIFLQKGSAVKYVTINTLLSFYKIFKNNEVRLYQSAFLMLEDAVKIGAEIDLYQFNFLVSLADYDEIEKIRKSYQTPRWKKLCSRRGKGMETKAVEEGGNLRQVAFDLNLDYHMNEEQICEKLTQISLMGEDQFFESAVKRQEERVALDVESPADLALSDRKGGERSVDMGRKVARCDPKTMILKNPYAYNDARMAFYRDPKDGKVYCFTSDTFQSLLSTRINYYNDEPLPPRFLQVIKAQLNTLKEIGVYETNTDIKDALKETFSRSEINNEKTDRQYSTVMTILGMNGVSEERFESLRSETLDDTILKSIAGVVLINFDTLPMILKQKTTARVIYSLAKRATPMSREDGRISDDLSRDLFVSIARAISGGSRSLEEYDEYGEPILDETGMPLPADDYDGIMGGNY